MERKLKLAGVFLLISFFALSGRPAEKINTQWSISYFGEDDFFHQPSDIEVSPKQSLIYIADSGNHRIVVFDYEGNFIRIIGKKGKGPGEFVKPTGLYVSDDSSVAVADINNNRIQIFDSSGGILFSVNTKEVRVADLLIIDDKFYTISSFGVSGYNLMMDVKKNTQSLVVVLDKEGNKIQSMTVSDFPENHPFIRSIKNRVSISLSPDGKLFLPYFALNVIQVFNLDGSRIAQFDRPLSFKPITPRLENQKSPRKGVIQMSANLDFVNIASKFGPDGYLYILTCNESLQHRKKKSKEPSYLSSLPMHFDVIDPDSHKKIRSITCDPGVKAFAIMDKSRLVYIHEDAEGELVLKCILY